MSSYDSTLGREGFVRSALSSSKRPRRGTTLTASEAKKVYGLCVPFVSPDVWGVYWPLAQRVAKLRNARSGPIVLGIAGSVAAGKSTVARLLTLMLRRISHEKVVHVSTDSFLLSNDELTRRGALRRKGWPESYDWPLLHEFINNVRGGRSPLWVPVYSHLENDIVEGRFDRLERVRFLVFEGLNALSAGADLASTRQFVDLGVFIDVAGDNLRQWYVERFLALRKSVFVAPHAYFGRYASLTQRDAVRKANELWRRINGPNLERHILPTRRLAQVVIRLNSDHSIAAVYERESP